MMKSCKHHTNAIDTPERAAEAAQATLVSDAIQYGKDFVADVITYMAHRQEVCCARALYARYLMSIAYREALLPSGWFDLPEVSIEPVFGPRCLLDDGDLYGGPYVAWVLGDDEYDEYNYWPSEDQLISWNEANDYLHEGDYE